MKALTLNLFSFILLVLVSSCVTGGIEYPSESMHKNLERKDESLVINPVLNKIAEKNIILYRKLLSLGIDTDELILTTKSLDLSNSNLDKLFGLNRFRALETLNLSNNNLNNIKDLINLNHLENLNISGNQLIYFPKVAFQEVLKSLDVSNNKLRILNSVLPFRNLEVLNLSNNKIQVSLNLNNLKKLEHVNLSGNDLSNVLYFKELHALKTLDLSNNPITKISIFNFPVNKGLGKLNLTKTKISNSDLLEIRILSQDYLSSSLVMF